MRITLLILSLVRAKCDLFNSFVLSSANDVVRVDHFKLRCCLIGRQFIASKCVFKEESKIFNSADDKKFVVFAYSRSWRTVMSG